MLQWQNILLLYLVGVELSVLNSQVFGRILIKSCAGEMPSVLVSSEMQCAPCSKLYTVQTEQLTTRWQERGISSVYRWDGRYLGIAKCSSPPYVTLVLSSVMQCIVMQCSVIYCSVVHCSVIQCSVLQYNTVQRSTV